jgi:DNA-binding MarR family transcriptional regulator
LIAVSSWRTFDYLQALHERGPMTDLDLALLMGVSTDDVRTALRGPVQRAEVTFQRLPDERRMLGLTDSGVEHVIMIGLEYRVLDLLNSFGGRSAHDLSGDLGVGREIVEVLSALAQGSWITGWDVTDPERDVSITDRGRARLDAAVDCGSYESAWRA